MKQGTPKNLDEAIVRAITIGPLSMVQTRVREVLKDFIAQKFAAAYLKLGLWEKGHSKETPEEILKNLFEAVTR